MREAQSETKEDRERERKKNREVSEQTLVSSFVRLTDAPWQISEPLCPTPYAWIC